MPGTTSHRLLNSFLPSTHPSNWHCYWKQYPVAYHLWLVWSQSWQTHKLSQRLPASDSWRGPNAKYCSISYPWPLRAVQPTKQSTVQYPIHDLYYVLCDQETQSIVEYSQRSMPDTDVKQNSTEVRHSTDSLQRSKTPVIKILTISTKFWIG